MKITKKQQIINAYKKKKTIRKTIQEIADEVGVFRSYASIVIKAYLAKKINKKK